MNELMREIEKRAIAETKLELIRKDWEILIKKQVWFSEELEICYDKYFGKSLAEKVGEMVNGVQEQTSESDGD